MEYEIVLNTEKQHVYRERYGIMAAFAWALDNFGLPGQAGNDHWIMTDLGRFKFASKADATMFALVWV